MQAPRFILFSFFVVLFYITPFCQAPNGYVLAWEDNFEGYYLDTTKWDYRSLGKRRDAFNTPDCVSVQNGYLALRTEQKNDTTFTAMISSKNKFETAFGYFEIRCLLQQEQGHWSAFWLQSDILGKHIGNPAKSGAEIDIYEFLPNKRKQIHHTIHYDGYGEYHKSVHKMVKNRRFNPATFHTFGVAWTPESYTFFIDGEATASFTEGISAIKQYLIISLEVGDWAGKISKARLPDYLIVDYVKVYKKQ